MNPPDFDGWGQPTFSLPFPIFGPPVKRCDLLLRFVVELQSDDTKGLILLKTSVILKNSSLRREFCIIERRRVG
jgi:hypothetical protein